MGFSISQFLGHYSSAKQKYQGGLRVLSTTKSGNRRFFYLIAAPTIIAVLATAVVITGMLVWSARRANEVAFDRQNQLVDLVLGQSVARIGHDQESITVWDDPIIKLREPVLDFEWLDANVGVWLYSYFGHDRVYVLSAGDKPVYAMQDGDAQ